MGRFRRRCSSLPWVVLRWGIWSQIIRTTIVHSHRTATLLEARNNQSLERYIRWMSNYRFFAHKVFQRIELPSIRVLSHIFQAITPMPFVLTFGVGTDFYAFKVHKVREKTSTNSKSLFKSESSLLGNGSENHFYRLRHQSPPPSLFAGTGWSLSSRAWR